MHLILHKCALWVLFESLSQEVMSKYNNTNKTHLRSVVGLSCLATGLVSGLVNDIQAQSERDTSTTGEAVAESILRSQTETKKGYFFNFDKWNLGVRPRLDVVYDNNINRAPDGEEIDDIILRPEVNFDFYRAITDFNSLDFTLGVGMDIYTKNTDVNTYSPIISPDSEIAYHMFIGDAHVKLREAFYYQESLNSSFLMESGELVDIRSVRFGRYNNRLGAEVDWDTGKFLFKSSFDWEWFHSNGSRYSYLDRNSGLFSQSASYFLTSNMQLGIELTDPVHFFEEDRVNNQFRLNAGPFWDMKVGERLNFRLGAGYSYATFWQDDGVEVTDDINDWYAYGSVGYTILPWLYNNFSIRRDNRISWNSDNQEMISISDSIKFTYIRDFSIDLFCYINLYEETGIQYKDSDIASMESYAGGIKIAYTGLGQWEPSLRYTYRSFSRENASWDDYQAHEVLLGIQYTF